MKSHSANKYINFKLSFQKIFFSIYKKIKYFVSNYRVKIFIIAAIFILLAASIMLFVERKYNEGYGGFLDAVYWTVVSVTSTGYGDISPKTPLGRFLTIFILLCGVIFIGSVGGIITSFLVERQLKEGKGLKTLDKMQNHFIICGWREGMEDFILELLKMNPEFTSEQIVLINMQNPDDIEALKNNPNLMDLQFVYGDFVEESTLQRANIKKAERIMVFADTTTAGSPQEADARTVMAIMTIDALNKNIYSCAEIFDKKFKRHLEISHCNEIILSRNYSKMILTNATSASGISHVISELLNVESNARMLSVTFPQEFISKTFKELQIYYERLDGSILIGMLENAGNVFLQKREALKEAQKTPDISKLVDNLKYIKTMIANKPVINPSGNYLLKKNSRAIIIEHSKAI